MTQAGSVTYQYDLNGNVSSDSSGRSFHYSLTDQALRISKGVASSEFHYGIDGQRIVRRDRVNGTVATRTHYVGTVEVYTEDNIRRYRRMIGGAAIATWYESTGVTQVSYLHKDHLGSLVAITDANGTPTAWMNYDPWGQRRSPEHWYPWQDATSSQIAAMLSVTPRGFTGHEHLDAVGVVHMNGRIYDPKLARMLQADPFIEDTGTLNRYTYAHNNPLSYTDPSGYFSLGKFLRTVVSIAIAVYSGGTAAGLSWGLFGASVGPGQAFASVLIGGALSGGISAGTVEGAAWGAFSAAIFFGIGEGLANAGKWAKSGVGTKLSGAGFAVKTVSHGIAGGAISRLQGGKFGHGFLSAAGSAATAPFADMSTRAGVYQGAVVSTIVGGTLSRLSGGKFANGAVTAAMGYAFNRMGELRHGALRDARAATNSFAEGFNPSDPNFHDNEFGPTFLCPETSGCFDEAVRLHNAESVPGMISEPKEGEIILNGFPGKLLPGVPVLGAHNNPIMHYRLQGENYVLAVNATLPGHDFHPGFVLNLTVKSGGGVWAYTRGLGTGAAPSWNSTVVTSWAGAKHLDLQLEMISWMNSRRRN